MSFAADAEDRFEASLTLRLQAELGALRVRVPAFLLLPGGAHRAAIRALLVLAIVAVLTAASAAAASQSPATFGLVTGASRSLGTAQAPKVPVAVRPAPVAGHSSSRASARRSRDAERSTHTSPRSRDASD